VVGQDCLDQYDESTGFALEALALNKWVRKDLNILRNISLSLQPREFVVVVGQSGGGKSTLVDAIAGYRPATSGKYTRTASMFTTTSRRFEITSVMCRNAILSIWN